MSILQGYQFLVAAGFSSLPSALSMSEKQAAAAIVLLGCVLWWFFSWSLALTVLNIGVALLYARPQAQATAKAGQRSKILDVVSAEQTHGGWYVKLLRAEIVTDETWSGELPSKHPEHWCACCLSLQINLILGRLSKSC